jgi:hypothetical protein
MESLYHRNSIMQQNSRKSQDKVTQKCHKVSRRSRQGANLKGRYWRVAARATWLCVREGESGAPVVLRLNGSDPAPDAVRFFIEICLELGKGVKDLVYPPDREPSTRARLPASATFPIYRAWCQAMNRSSVSGPDPKTASRLPEVLTFASGGRMSQRKKQVTSPLEVAWCGCGVADRGSLTWAGSVTHSASAHRNSAPVPLTRRSCASDSNYIWATRR